MKPAQDDDTAVLLACLDAAIDAVRAGPALARALASVAPPARAPWVLALGKAAPEMAGAMVAWLASHRLEPAGGIIVSHRPAPSPHHLLPVHVGDHPVPGDGSVAASGALASVVAGLPPSACVEVLISGGTTALLGAPLDGSLTDVAEHASALLGSGEDILSINRARRRRARWAAGRLAEALGPRDVRAWVLSDVPGDPLWAIGSGPLVPDEHTPPAIPHVVIANNATAVDAAEREARVRGFAIARHAHWLAGEPTAVGRDLHAQLRRTRPTRPTVHLWGGETSARLPPAHGPSGRCQHLALAAAEGLHDRGPGEPRIVLLAAGTDGRDGTTDAAGGIVSGTTWGQLIAAGLDPRQHLARYDAHHALDAVGAVVRTGPTGTNVADLVLAMVRPA